MFHAQSLQSIIAKTWVRSKLSDEHTKEINGDTNVHQSLVTLTINFPVVFPPDRSLCACLTPSAVNGYSLKMLIFNVPSPISS